MYTRYNKLYTGMSWLGWPDEVNGRRATGEFPSLSPHSITWYTHLHPCVLQPPAGTAALLRDTDVLFALLRAFCLSAILVVYARGKRNNTECKSI